MCNEILFETIYLVPIHKKLFVILYTKNIRKIYNKKALHVDTIIKFKYFIAVLQLYSDDIHQCD